MTSEEINSRLAEIQTAQRELNEEFEGRAFSADAKGHFESLQAEKVELERLNEELETRRTWIEASSHDPEKREPGAQFQTRKPGAARGNDIYDLSEITYRASRPELAALEMRDRARFAIEQATFPHERANREDVQGRMERFLGTIDDELGSLSRHILTTGSPIYKRAFGKYLQGQTVTADEQKALDATRTALSTTGAQGGFAVPFSLDPTVIPTSNHSVNPYRALARVETITTTKWQGVTSVGMTAAYASEAAEATDGSPVLAQPEATPVRAQAFVPFSIEIGQDWNGLQTEIARMLQDAKDDLEADRFTLGTAAAPAPDGILVSGTATVSTSGSAAFAAADLYALEQALPPRFRPRASFVGNKFIYNKVRQFTTYTSGDASLWSPVGAGIGNQTPTPGRNIPELLGYPAGECSAYPSVLTTGTKLLTLGDWNYFLIVDRVGMSVEVIPHLFGGVANYPTGQRGLYAYWRNTTKVLSPNAFRTLVSL